MIWKYLLLLVHCVVLSLSVSTTTAASPGGALFKDAAGLEVRVPHKVERLVVLSEIDLDVALSLGLKPIGAINGRGQKSLPHYLQASQVASILKDIEIVGDLGRPKVEAIVKLKPDLILTSALRPEILQLLSKIAPTFVSHKNNDNWQDVFRRVAAVLAREPQARSFLSTYEKELQAARARLATLSDKTVSIIRWNPNGPAFMYRDSFASLVLREMGLERPKSQQVPGTRHSMPLSLEALDLIDAGWLFIGTLDPRGDAAAAVKEVEKNAAFQRLSAVRSKRFFAVDGSKWTSMGGPLAALSIVQETTHMLSSSRQRL